MTATLNLAVNPAGAVSGSQAAENALDDVKAAAVGAENALEDVGKAGVVAGRGMKSASAGMGMAKGSGKQLMMQMSQVVDMGAATGQWGKSFLLQLTDMAMFVGGPWTIAIAGAASVLGTLGLSFLKSSKEGNGFKKAMQSITEETHSAKRELAALVRGLNSVEELALVEEMARLDEKIAGLRERQAEQSGRTAHSTGMAADRIQRQRDKIEEALNEHREQNSLLQNTLGIMDDINSSDMGSGIRSATGDAMQLVTVLTQAQAMAQAQSDALMDRGSLQSQYAMYGAGKSAGDKLAAKQRYSVDGRAFALPKVPKTKGGGSGISEIDQMRNAYDNLYESLDPVVAATNEWNEAQETINAALAKGYATTEEAARVTSLARKEYEEAIAATKEGVDVWGDFEKASVSALESIFDGAKTAREAVGELILSLAQALLKKNALAAVESGRGGFLGRLFAGLFDGGGKIGFGQTGIVGENGPEAVTATGGGAIVTSRADTARRSSYGGGVNISIDARGAQEGVADQIANQLRAIAPSLIQAGAERGYKMTRENFGAMQVENSLYGAML